MAIFRLYTEGGAEKIVHVIKEVTKKFEGFTLIEGKGYYKGKPEDSVVVEIVSPHEDYPVVAEVARKIARVNKQESVMITDTPCEGPGGECHGHFIGKDYTPEEHAEYEEPKP